MNCVVEYLPAENPEKPWRLEKYIGGRLIEFKHYRKVLFGVPCTTFIDERFRGVIKCNANLFREMERGQVVQLEN